jgi:Domain of Unknown Function (DUF1543).
MVLLGCKPKSRNTEQHDIFFSIGKNLKELKHEMLEFWPDAGEKIHVDAWREITKVEDYKVEVRLKSEQITNTNSLRIFFINLGGYKKAEFEEFHYKMIVVAEDKGIAIKKAKQTAFYKHFGFEGAESHIDDKYGIDVDDIYDIGEALSDYQKEKYKITIQIDTSLNEDEIFLGYLKFNKI